MEPLPWYRIATSPTVILALIIFAWWKPHVRVLTTLMGVGMLCGFGIVMDQFSARLCPEYFTVLHNPIPRLNDPTLVGIVWGILGGTGGGVAFGYVVGVAATIGPRPQLTCKELIRPMLLAMAGISIAVALTGGIVWRNASGLHVQFDPEYGIPIPLERQVAALTVASYHMMAYLAAVLATVVLCLWIGQLRKRLSNGCLNR
jgi:hypothetical protein